MRDDRRHVGQAAEEAAADYLEQVGYRILVRNHRSRLGELDVVALDGSCIVFVEVRAKRSARFGTAEESVSPAKQRRLVRLAGEFLGRMGLSGRECRFDVVAVEMDENARPVAIRLVRDAFAATGKGVFV